MMVDEPALLSFSEEILNKKESYWAECNVSSGIVCENTKILIASSLNAKITGFETIDKIIGRTASESPIFKPASHLFHQQDLIVFDTREPLYALEVFKFEGVGLKALLTTKIPLVQCDNKCKQIYFSSQVCADKVLYRILGLSPKKYCYGGGIKYGTSFTLIDRYPDLNLSFRESECFFFVIHGRTTREISDTLHISQRTVETHMDHIKAKLNCLWKSELIELAFYGGLMHYIPKRLIFSKGK